MSRKIDYDAVVVGSGPNGLASAIRLAQRRLSVLLIEGNSHAGGGCRSEELTVPGYVHDICSSVHPLAIGSPFLRTLALGRFGLDWVQPQYPLAHPLSDGSVVVLQRSIEATAQCLGTDERSYLRLMGPFVSAWEALCEDILGPILHIPRHPDLALRFGLLAVRSARSLARTRFQTEAARALFGGLAAHSFLRLDQAGSAAFALVLGAAAHAVGWPMPQGGAQRLTDALAARFRDLGGELLTGLKVRRIEDLPLARATLLDIGPRQLLAMAGNKLPSSCIQRLKAYRYGPGVFKIDYALSHPIPWRNRECLSAGTVHLGGGFEEIAASEADVAEGRVPRHPFVLLTQPSLFDNSRAPAGKHVAWAYCHVPNGCEVDMTSAMEEQIERFAPRFRSCIIGRHTMDSRAMELRNPNMVGGDISGGLSDLRQLVARPVLSMCPYRTPIPGVYLCSASTPPGGGVHGMCGFHAAATALRDWFT